MRLLLLLTPILFTSVLYGQAYTVNSTNDVDDGVCNAIHCSLREAINASESDGVPSTINFNITGLGPHLIVPSSPFPTITKNDLSIIGESQPGGPSSIVIDFSYRNFNKVGFWHILGEHITISGINFTNFLFNNYGDHLLQFGDFTNNATDCKIYNCSFISDNSSSSNLDSNLLIFVYKADNMIISNNNFGTDHMKSTINNLGGYIRIAKSQGIGKVTIDSNIFVNKTYMIQGDGGDLSILRNIFGALDTSKIVNFLNPKIGIRAGENIVNLIIDDNFFNGFTSSSGGAPVIAFTISNADCIISKNRFYNCSDVAIEMGDNYNAKIKIVDNYARHGGVFILELEGPDVELYMERNDVDDYYNFYLFFESVYKHKLIRHIDNKMTCIKNNVVWTNVPEPKVNSVNRNQITGTGNAHDSIVVYYNPRIGCPNANCQGGYELGRTKADASGNWVLNATYPNKSSISAFQFNGNFHLIPNYYSGFSECYQCQDLVKTNFYPSLCSGQTFNYNGKIYSETNPKDSIFISGDGVSICDSVILIDLDYHPSIRRKIDTFVCYGDTLDLGSTKIFNGHLTDSLILQSSTGCDSLVVINGKNVGISNYSNSYCDSTTVKIGNTTFDKNNTSGIARIPGAAVSGCDSVIFVNLSFNFSSESFLNKTLCRGQSVNVSGQVFNESRPNGDVLMSKVSGSGCDSIVHVSLSFPDNRGFFLSRICSGDSILVEKEYFSESKPSGVVTILNGSSFGCDSLINVNISFIPEAKFTYQAQICRKDSIQVGNQFFSESKPSGIVRFINASSTGCDSIVNVALTFNPPIFLDFKAEDLNCNLANTGELVLQDIHGGLGNFKVSIDNGSLMDYKQGAVIGQLSQGSHSITISDQSYCDTVYNFKINNSQILTLKLPNDTTVHKGDLLDIPASINFKPMDIKWSPPLYLTCDTCLNTQSKPDETITYKLTITDYNDCLIEDYITIAVIIDHSEVYFPTVFSPNGDNINDIFSPVFNFSDKTRITVFQIFDRWGNLLYERLNGQQGEILGWNGEANNEKVNPGVYVYAIQFIGEDGVTKWKTGDITLVR